MSKAIAPPVVGVRRRNCGLAGLAITAAGRPLAGGTIHDVVKIVTYITDRKHRETAYPVIHGYFGDLRPCGTGIVVAGCVSGGRWNCDWLSFQYL